MSKRIRIPQRQAAQSRRAVEDSIPYPGTVNQPERPFKKMDQYSNWKMTVNHPYPDMRHLWQDDKRDDIGFGIPEAWGQSPTNASIKVAANKAVKLAYLLLGEKVDEEVIERQAEDFMLLGPEALDRALARFSRTSELYKAGDDEDEDDDDSKEASSKVAEESEEEADDEAEGKEASAKAVKAEDEEDDDEESKEASTKQAKKKKADEAEEKAEEKAAETIQEEKEEAAKEASNIDSELANEFEFHSSTEDVDLSSQDSDTRLAALFEDGIPAELPQPGTGRESSAKKGVRSLGGALPKVAGSGDKVADISELWSGIDAPDISDVFR